MNKFILIIFILIISCSANKLSNYHGSKSLENKYNQIQVNITNQNDLILILGHPASQSDFNKNKWYYFERRKINQSLLKLGRQKIEKNNVLIVEFDNRGLLKNKNFLNLDDMNDVKYLKKVTKKDFERDDFIYGVLTSLREKINAPARKRSGK